MNSQNQVIANREALMDFFRDHKKLNLLSKEDKMEIAEQLLAKDISIKEKLLNDMLQQKGVSYHQILAYENSLPVF